MDGIWPRPGRVVALNPALVKRKRWGRVRRHFASQYIERQAELTYHWNRPQNENPTGPVKRPRL